MVEIGVTFVVLLIWTFIWKGIALWMSARREHKYWFIAMFVINTLGILPIGYIIWQRNGVKKGKPASKFKKAKLKKK